MNRVTGSVGVSCSWKEETRFRRVCRWLRMTKIYDIPEYILVSYVLFWFGFFFHFIGFVAPNWYSYTKYGNTTIYGGIWRTCDKIIGCHDIIDGDVSSWMEATQTFEIFGFLILLVTAAIFTAKLCRFENKTDKYTWIIIGLLFTSCFFVMLGFIIFASAAPAIIQTNMDFAFGMIIVAAIFLVLSGNFFVLDATK
ncbi:Hypothetical predicted protein [Mytilus galloprovincialis]|uniref:Uncharacterized protein n=1 Tax=Mytilus galloprovincialis TaxID=29158 RepID=A0A8B6FJM6_MYTGA|nr:Hypothetical predicted protein [Mytilus galloprovincialis]